ncbi:hypothetical protein DQ04_11251000 [Trypanosoma grayi]|uniref:hypothetical protein n=1 Tax=Trypanosoma grayi TaxID=71804 RepID=UPI0004F43ADD|nr:hypothetical protein DQ04_11251000 [Trypanosoma grayi]KEG07013.1 hypothetical protein DQ04_11251000 [Trypanosoma grayi]
MDFMIIDDTEVNFNALLPYYGMGVLFAPNLPSGIAASDYMMVRSFNDCQYTTTTCTDTVGCHRMTRPAHLPPPGKYWLCLTSNGWNSQYLLWGVESLEVKVLLATPLYLTAGTDRKVVLQDAESVVSVPGRVFLAPCPGNNCPLVTTGSGEEVVHRDACVNTSVSSRVYLSDLRVLSAEAGVYAVCVDDGGDGEYTAPAALPVTVLEKPFAFKIASDTDKNTVNIGVGGGDLKWRREPYTVCAVPQSDTCDSVSAGPRMCVNSELPWSSSVFMNLTGRGMFVKDMRFCFIAANVTIGGRTYTQMQNMLEDDCEPTTRLSAGAIAGVVIAGIVLLIVLVAAVVYVLHQQRKNRRVSLDSGTRPSPAVPHSVQKKSNPLTTVSVGTSPHTHPPTPVPPQGDGAAQVPVAEQPSNTAERHMDPTNIPEVMDGNSVPLVDTQEGDATNTTGIIAAANNSRRDNNAEKVPMADIICEGPSNENVLGRTTENAEVFHTILPNSGDGGVLQTAATFPERKATEEIPNELSVERPRVERQSVSVSQAPSPPSAKCGAPEGASYLPLTEENLSFFRPEKMVITHPFELLRGLEECGENYPEWADVFYQKCLDEERRNHQRIQDWLKTQVKKA